MSELAHDAVLVGDNVGKDRRVGHKVGVAPADGLRGTFILGKVYRVVLFLLGLWLRT